MVFKLYFAALVVSMSLSAATVQGMSFQEAALMSQDDARELWQKHQTLLPAGATWTSQVDQDRWAATFAFPTKANSIAGDINAETAKADAREANAVLQEESSGHKPRYFVEVGAADGIDLSNTYALETHLGWRGLCLEASPSSLVLLRTNRPACTVVDAVVGARSGEVVQFTSFAGEANRLFSGVAANEYYHLFGDDSDMTNATRAQLQRFKNSGGAAVGLDGDNRDGVGGAKGDDATVATRTTESLADLLDRHGAPLHVDFLSLDCEGLEADVLAAFPFHRRSFGAIVVDHGHTPTKRQRIASTLVAAGYVRTGCLDHDDAYVPRASLLSPNRSPLSRTTTTTTAMLESGEDATTNIVAEANAEHLSPFPWEPVIADTADSCNASSMAMVQVTCSQATKQVAYATEFHAAAARRVCAAAHFQNDAACDTAVFARARAHCFENRAKASSSTDGTEGGHDVFSGGSMTRGTEIYTFPLISDRSSPSNFTLLRVEVELGTPGSVELLSFAFPMLPKRADRAESARIIARLFCQRTGWANDETAAELEEFLVAGVEKWVDRERARALSTADATLAESNAAITAQQLKQYFEEGPS